MKVALDKNAIKPTRAHTTDAGLDLYSPRSLLIPAGGSGVIDTGVHVEIPHGRVGLLKSKSGLNVKHDLVSEGVIDEGYSGSIVVKLYNLGKTGYLIEREDKISQLLVVPVDYVDVEIVDSLNDDTERGSNGFGSTGR